MLKTLSDVRQTWLEGERYDLPDDRAQNWVRSGVAEPEVPSPVAQPRKATRKAVPK